MDPPHQRGFDNQPPEQISAREATRLLGVKAQTLYSYVSRGWVRSTPAARGNERLYVRADVERLKARGQARAGHAAVAAGALRWGEPILSTSISTIRDVGPVYRGHAATDLVRQGASFESVAELCSKLDDTALACWPRWYAAQIALFSWMLFGYGLVLVGAMGLYVGAAIQRRRPWDIWALVLGTVFVMLPFLIAAGIHADSVARAITCPSRPG